MGNGVFLLREKFGTCLAVLRQIEYRVISKAVVSGRLISYFPLKGTLKDMFIALMILTESLFRFFFFYKLPEVKNWKPEKRETVVSYLENNYSSARLTVLTVLLLALAAVIPLYTYIEEMKGIEYYLNYLIAAVALVFAVIVIIALVRKKRNK